MITGETIIKGLLFYILKSRAAVGEIHHWASGDYKKDVHGWKKIKKDIQKHLESEYESHYLKHGEGDSRFAKYEREGKLSALNNRLEQLEKNPEKFKSQIEETKKYITNLSRGKSRASSYQPSNVKGYKKELKETLISKYKDFIIKQAETVFGSKIGKLTEKINAIQPKIDSLKDKLEKHKEEYKTADPDRQDEIDDESYEVESEIDELQEKVDDYKSDIQYLEEEKQETIDSKLESYESDFDMELDYVEGDAMDNASNKYDKSKESDIRSNISSKYSNNKKQEYETNPASIKEINIQHAKRTKELSNRVKKILLRLNRGKK